MFIYTLLYVFVYICVCVVPHIMLCKNVYMYCYFVTLQWAGRLTATSFFSLSFTLHTLHK